MADRIKGITIEIGGDTTKLTNALKDVNKEIKNTQSDLRDVEKLLKLDPGNTELLTQKQQLLSKAVGDTKEKLEKLKEAQRQMNASGVDKSSAEYQALEREIIDCEQALKKMEKAASQSNVTLQKVAVAGEKFKSVGSGLEAVGQEVSKASAVVATGMGTAVKVTMDYEASMSKVKALLGGTDEEFNMVDAAVRQLAQDTKYSASEVAEGAQYMALAGWEAKDITASLGSVLKLAAASGEDLATVSDIVTDVMTAYGLEADRAADFTDVLATTMAKSNTDISGIGEAMKYVGTVAGGMGYSIEDTALAIGLMANNSVKGSQAGTALRSIMSRMADPTDKVANAMDELGISLYDSEGNMYSFKEVMEQIRSGFGELKISEEELNSAMADLDSQLASGTITEKEYDKAIEDLMTRAYGAEGAMKAQYASILAGKNALAGYLAIVNTSDEDYAKLTNEIYNCKDATEDMYKVMTDNLQGELDVLKSKLEELGIQFGTLLLPYVKDFVEKLQGLVDKFNNMDEGTQKMILAVGAFIVVLGPLLLIIGKLLIFVGMLMTYLPVIVPVITAIVGSIGLIPIAIGFVIAAIVVWIKHWDDIKLAAKMAVEEIVYYVGIAFDKIKEILGNLVNAFREKFPWLSQVVDMYIDNITNKFENFKTIVKGVIETVKGLLSGQLKFPDIKLPHFSYQGKFSLNPPSVPQFKVQWYKKAYDDAYILNSPTIFGSSGGQLLGGGEGNGSEAIVGTDKLMSMMAEVVGNANSNITVVLEGDAEGVFNLVRTENSKFMKSNGGYSPLVS